MKWRRLRRNHGNWTPTALVCVDTESTEVRGDARGTAFYPLRLGVARYCRVEKGKATRRDLLQFTDATVFWDWICSKMDPKRTLWLWAHNLGWDLCALQFWRELESCRFKVTGPPRRKYNKETGQWEKHPIPGHLITADPPTALRVWDKTDRSLRACDTFNWFRCSLARVGGMVGCAKLPMPAAGAPDSSWFSYCRNDCEIVERAVLELIGMVKRHDLGNFKITPAAQAFAAFSHWAVEGVIGFNPDEKLAWFERQAYYGGRKSVFFAGEVRSPSWFGLVSGQKERNGLPVIEDGPVHHFDLTAAYASVMRKNLYPCQKIRQQASPKVDYLADQMREFGAVAWVTVESYSEPYPRRGKLRVDWLVGRFDTYLCGPELSRALAAGHVQRVYYATYYRLAELFTDYVDRLTRIEQLYPRETEPIRREVAKSIRNALYGKFGQWSRGWELVPGAVAPDPWGEYYHQLGPGGEIEHRRSIAHAVQRRVDGPMVPWTFPAISAYVASYCRERMRQLRETARPWNVFYLDADSIHVSPQGAKRLDAAGELADDAPGKLRRVRTADRVIYKGPKWFVWNDQEVNAGLHRNALAVGGRRYVVEDFPGLDQVLKNGRPDAPEVVTKMVEAPVHQLAAVRTDSGWTRPLTYVDPLRVDHASCK